jgi:hypothetical protein
MAEVSVDQTVHFGRVPGRRLPGGSRGLARLARLAAGTPCRPRLGHPQCTVADGKEPGRRSREQARSGHCGHKTANSDRGKEPETEGTEEYDKESDENGQSLPGTLVAVPVEVERDFASGEDGQEQACPYQGGVLAAVEGLGSEIACHAVQCDGTERQHHLPRQRRVPSRVLGLDGLISELGGPGLDRRVIRGTGAARSDIGGPACAQALVLDFLVGRVDIADEYGRVDGRDDHDQSTSFSY